MIEFRNIEKSFGKYFTLRIDKLITGSRGVLTVIGPNGSGKTTLLKMLLGLVVPDKGEIFFDNKPVIHNIGLKREINYMPQVSSFPPFLKLSEILSILKDLRNNTDNLDYDLFCRLNIEKNLEKKFISLSQGSKQRFGVALAFLFDSSVIVLDEPTAGLDPFVTEIVKENIRKSAESKLIILTTHSLSDISELTDRAVFLDEGKIMLDEEFTGRSPAEKRNLIKQDVYQYFKSINNA